MIAGTTGYKRCGCESSPSRISSPLCLYGGDHERCYRILYTPLKNMCMKLEPSVPVRCVQMKFIGDSLAKFNHSRDIRYTHFLVSDKVCTCFQGMVF